MATSTKTRTLMITRGASGNYGGNAPLGRMKITIPATAKITFGMMQPGVRGGHGIGEGSTLRIYEGTKQTAVFQNVIEFRDDDYPVQVEEIEVVEANETLLLDGRKTSAKADKRLTGVFVDTSTF